MKNISFASLLAFGMLSFVLSFAIMPHGPDLRNIFHVQSALAVETTPINIYGVVRQGENASATNPGLSGVSVDLIDLNGTVINNAISDDQGNYSFLSVAAASRVCPATPDGYVLIAPGLCQNIDPNAVGDLYLDQFTFAPQIADALAPPATLNIFGMVSGDDGARALLSVPGAVSLEVRDATGTVIATATTDRSGSYVFSLTPAHYSVCIVMPGGYGLTSGASCQSVDFADNTDVTLPSFVLSTLPLIDRVGDGVLTLSFGTTYVDLGATAQKDGRDLTDQIRVTNAVDTNIPGTYVVTYAVVDPLTSLGATTSRVVTVLPKITTATGGGTVLGSAAPAISTSPVMVVNATTSTSSGALIVDTAMPSSPKSPEEVVAKKLLRERLRAKAMGSVLGIETAATTSEASPIVVTTKALDASAFPQQTLLSYAKPILSLLGFGFAIYMLWWWKARQLK